MNIYLLLALLAFVGCAGTVSRPENYREDKSFHPRSKKPAYINLHPKVCFDEGHNNLAVEFGFYDTVLSLLESDGYQIIRLKKRFTSDVLKGCKVVYSSTVSGHPDADAEKADDSAFDAEEIESIVKWVREGGSFLMMSDHGVAARASAKLLKQFGVFGSVETVKHAKAQVSVFSDPGIFTLQGKDLNPQSSIVLGRNFSERLKKVEFFRGQALRGPKGADHFLRIPAEALVGDKPNPEFKSVGVALRFGRGRLVVIGDGSVFAAKIDVRNQEKTGLNRDTNDNVQMALNVFRWLSGAFY